MMGENISGQAWRGQEKEGGKRRIRIGTRQSRLSVAQAMLVSDAIKRVCPEIDIELVCRSTLGDQIQDRPLLAFGGKGVFVSEFEEALKKGEIDFAVHSAKDLPADLAEGLEIIGVLPRGDVRDVLVSMTERKLEEKDIIRIGTSSARRKIQIEELGKKFWPGKPVVCANLRGNVLTRLEKLEEGDYDGIILAAAGLERLHIHQEGNGKYQYRYFSPEEMIPAGGQGILAIEGRTGDPVNQIAEAVSDGETMKWLKAERRVLALLGAGCHEPVGVYCRPERAGTLLMTGIYEKDRRRQRVRVWGTDWEETAGKLAEQLIGRK